MSHSKPCVLLLSFEKEAWLEQSSSQLFGALRKHAVVLSAEQISTAINYLSAYPPPHAVLITDAAIARREYGPVVARLVSYARAGGRVLLGCHFSNNFPLDAAQAFFHQWDLPWDAGSYHRTTFARNPAGVPAPLDANALFPTFSMKALHLANVAPAAAVYLATEASHVESYVFPRTPITGAQLAESPAVFAPIGSGYLGYVGDVNGEQGATRLLLEMCGIKIQPGDLGPNSFGLGTALEAEIPLPAGQTVAPAPVSDSGKNPERPLEQAVRVRAAERTKRAEENRVMADSLKNQGNALFKQEKWKEAAIKYSDAAKLAGPHPVYLSNLAQALLNARMCKNIAESAADRALRYEPRNTKARHRRGLARMKLKDYAGAISDFRAVLRVDPSSSASRSEMNRALLSYVRLYGLAFEDDGQRPEEEESLEDIDTYSMWEDAEHLGNGQPCRSYNEGDCKDGPACRFRHAPDDTSVRDELGRNVCVGWLLGACADPRCGYAHDRLYLPARGWWADARRVARAAACVQHLPAPTPAQATHVVRAAGLLWQQDLWTDRRGELRAARGASSEDEDEDEYYAMEEASAAGAYGGDAYGGAPENFGYSERQVGELLSYGVSPWDDDADDVLAAVSAF